MCNSVHVHVCIDIQLSTCNCVHEICVTCRPIQLLNKTCWLLSLFDDAEMWDDIMRPMSPTAASWAERHYAPSCYRQCFVVQLTHVCNNSVCSGWSLGTIAQTAEQRCGHTFACSRMQWHWCSLKPRALTWKKRSLDSQGWLMRCRPTD